MLLRKVGTFHCTRLNIPEESGPLHVAFSDVGSAVGLKREFIATCADLLRHQNTPVDPLCRPCSKGSVLVNCLSDTQ